jgi:predicted RNA methylase
VSFACAAVQFILREAASWGADVEVLAEMQFDVPQVHKFHKRKSVDIAVDLIRVGKRAPS